MMVKAVFIMPWRVKTRRDNSSVWVSNLAYFPRESLQPEEISFNNIFILRLYLSLSDVLYLGSAWIRLDRPGSSIYTAPGLYEPAQIDSVGKKVTALYENGHVATKSWLTENNDHMATPKKITKQLNKKKKPFLQDPADVIASLKAPGHMCQQASWNRLRKLWRQHWLKYGYNFQ